MAEATPTTTDTAKPTAPTGPTSSTSTGTRRPQRLAREHQTDITFDEYLIEITSISAAANTYKEAADNIANWIGKVSEALREMSTDLIGDHNLDTQFTDLIADLADDAGVMKLQAERAAADCDNAAQGAIVAGQHVARTYGQDMQAVEDAGLTYASAAAHH